MKPFFTKVLAALLLACAALPLSAQDAKLDVSASLASQSQGAHPLSHALDGQGNTIWHSPWGGTPTTFPVTLTFRLAEAAHVDYVRYIPRTDGNSNGNWMEVSIFTSAGTDLTATSGWTHQLTANLGGSGATSNLYLGDQGVDNVRTIRIRIDSGQGGWASAAEIQFFRTDRTKENAFRACFQDALCTTLRSDVTTASDIADPDVRQLVGSMLEDAEAYRKFRVGSYEPYRPTESLRQELGLWSQYNNWENPTGVYLTSGQPVYLFVQGIGSDPVRLNVKNWLLSESSSTYTLNNGLNLITPTTTGNAFVQYYTENYRTAPNVRVHFVNAQVQGYYDQETMTNADWLKMLEGRSRQDSTILITRSRHAQLAFPVCSYLTHCPTDIDSLLTLYQQVQDTERDLMGLNRYGRNPKNRQLYYASTYGFMAATFAGGSFCHINYLYGIMRPEARLFDIWGVAHEWGHNNQFSPGFHWSGLGEVTNNLYSAWAQFLHSGNRNWLRLEDENAGINEYGSLRGGRMQCYLEEGVRKQTPWMRHRGPGGPGDPFVTLAPLWQLQLWGEMAGRSPHLYRMFFEGLRRQGQRALGALSNGQQQMNFMRLVCDSTRMNLLPFFERAGLLRPIDEHINDYTPGQHTITQQMIDDLKSHVARQGYQAVNEEVNYINGHNYPIFRDRLALQVPQTLGEGCTRQGSLVRVEHSAVRNAVAYETYDAQGELLRITMYGLGSNDAHSFTQVLYPNSEGAAYIMAVGYDGTRERIYEFTAPTFQTGRLYTLRSNSQGGCLSTQNSTVNVEGTIQWNLTRTAATGDQPGHLWLAEERGGKTYFLNLQTGHYLGGTANTAFNRLLPQSAAPHFVMEPVDVSGHTWTLALNGGGQYLNAYSATNTGFWGGASADANNIWVVEEAASLRVNVPATGYRAVCYPVALSVPEGFTAYAVESLHEQTGSTYAFLSDLGRILPANTPAILFKNGGGVATMTLLPADATAAPGQNLLQGTVMGRTGLAAAEQLALSGTSLQATTGTSLAANSAFLLSTQTTATTVPLLADGEYAARVRTELAPLFTSGVGHYFGLSREVYEAYAQTCEERQLACDRSQFIELDAAVRGGTLIPETGYYRLKNLAYNTYLGAESNLMQQQQAAGVATIVKLERNAAGTAYALRIQGRYMQTPVRGQQVGLGENPVYFTPVVRSPGRIALSANPEATHAALHQSINQGNIIVGWTNSAGASLWQLEKADTAVVRTHTIGSAAYATLYVPFAYTLPADVKAYTGRIKDDRMLLTPVVGTVPAATPVVVVNQSGTPASVTLRLSGEEEATVSENLLTGTYLKMPWNAAAGLSLGRINDRVGFYHWTGTTLGANRAYVAHVPADIKGLTLITDDTSTGLSSLLVEEADAQPRYNLSGQRVDKSYRGVVIRQGRKVVQ